MTMQDETPADISNWRQGPFNHWAFRNVARILPTAPIAAASLSRPLPRSSAGDALAAFSLDSGGGKTLNLADFHRITHTDGLLVIKDGQVVHESYGNGLTPDAPHILMSASKSITGLLSGILADQGILDIDAPVAGYVPEIAGSGYATATIRHLLDMRADPGFDAAQLQAYAIASGWEAVAADAAPTGLHAFFAGLPSARGRIDTPFRYLSASTDLLGWAIERATGRSFAENISALLWQPMGAEDGAFITLDRNGAPRATGGLCATLRDFARIGQVMVDGGMNGAVRVLPPSWLDDIADNGDRQAWATGEFAEGFAGLSMRYRNNWYVIDNAPQLLFAMGIHGENLFVDRANRIVIAKFSSQPEPLDRMMIRLTQFAAQRIRMCLLA
jgi:CubicO group peptidase (beta-lactamase class C family)